jgi:hypothetical protein
LPCSPRTRRGRKLGYAKAPFYRAATGGSLSADIIDLVPLLRVRRRREKLTDRDIRRTVLSAENAKLDRDYRALIKRNALDLIEVAERARHHKNERY